VAVTVAVLGIGVVLDQVGEAEQVTEAPATGVLEGNGLLDFRVDLVVLAVQVGQTVVLPLQQIVGNSLTTSQQAGGQDRVRDCAYSMQINRIHGGLPSIKGLSLHFPDLQDKKPELGVPLFTWSGTGEPWRSPWANSSGRGRFGRCAFRLCGLLTW